MLSDNLNSVVIRSRVGNTEKSKGFRVYSVINNIAADMVKFTVNSTSKSVALKGNIIRKIIAIIINDIKISANFKYPPPSS